MTEPNPRRWFILGIMCTCLVLIVASVAALNNGIPAIQKAIEPSQTQTLWIIDAYALVFAGLLLPAGALGDRYGRKGALLIGLVIFAAAAVAASMSDGPNQLIALRASMGVGAALIMPATLSTITVVFPPEERAKAIAVWAGFAGAGGALGSLASGLLLRWFWWGSIFFVNVPLVLLAAVPILLFVPTSRDEEGRPLDIVGAVLSIVGFTSLVFAIIEGPEEGWSSAIVLGGFALAVVALVGFVLYELRTTHPMLDPRNFTNRKFALGSLTITNAFLVMFGAFFGLTLYFQFVRGNTPLMAAVRVLPFPATMIMVAPRGPRLAARIGNRQIVALGQTVAAAAFVWLSFMRPNSSYILLVIGMVGAAAGMALMSPTATTAIMSTLPPHKAGVGSAVNDTSREVGGAVGIALMGSLVSTGYRNGLGDATESLPPEAADTVRDGIQGAFAVTRSMAGEDGAALFSRASEAFSDGMRIAFLASAGIALVTSFVTRRYWPSDDKPMNAAPVAAATGATDRPG